MFKKICKSIFSKHTFKKIFYILNDNLNNYISNSYSLEGEDLILKEIFCQQDEGFYVDVGAFHPKKFSNTYYFYKKGWKGINIDAMPGSMKIFEKMRPRDTNIEKAVFNEKKSLIYYAFNEPALNGFSKSLSERNRILSEYKIIFTKRMQTSTLTEILDEHLPKKQEIDFLSIDVEGLDFAVLQSINLNKFKPKVILIEIFGDIEYIIENKNQIVQYLKKNNYSLCTKTIRTAIFVIHGMLKDI